MRRTVSSFWATIIDLAGDIGTEAEDLGEGGDTIAAARCALLLLRAQRAMNRARDAIRAAKQQRGEKRKDYA